MQIARALPDWHPTHATLDDAPATLHRPRRYNRQLQRVCYTSAPISIQRGPASKPSTNANALTGNATAKPSSPAQARHEQTLRRAEAALNSLARRGEPVTVRGVADAARVSRSWIYQQPRLLAEIDRLRQPRRDKQRAVPASQKATIDSLRQQLHAYRDEITRLRAEIAYLREQLARQLGAARTAAITSRIGNVLDMSTTPKP
jgi:uncharacterized coiled-coil protein SlyX